MSATLLVFLASVGAGGLGSLVGIGGGLVIVPVLSVLLHYDIKLAIAASLIGVIATSIAATSRYLGAGIADRRLGLQLLVATALGGLVGGLTSRYLDGTALKLLFGGLLLLVAIQMASQLRLARGQVVTGSDVAPPPDLPPDVPVSEGAAAGPDGGFDSAYLEPSTGQVVPYRARHMAPGMAVSFVAGNVSGLLGVGGGVINVPTMNVLMGVPLRVATTTSTYMLAATAATSAILNAAGGTLDPLLAAPVALGVFVGARVGAGLSMRVSQTVIRVAFIGVALFFAWQMLSSALSIRVLG